MMTKRFARGSETHVVRSMFWNNMNLSLLTEFCMSREALWLPVTQATRFSPTIMLILLSPTPYILWEPVHCQGWLPTQNVLNLHCCDKTLTKSNLGRKVVVPFSSQSIMKGSRCRSSRQEPGGRTWSRGHRETLPTGLFALAWPVYFLIIPRTTCLGWQCPCPGWAGLSRSINNQENACRQSDGGIFSKEVPLSGQLYLVSRWQGSTPNFHYSWDSIKDL